MSIKCQKKLIDIGIGGYHASRNPIVLRTLLGSCVAVCLHDPQRKIGGMNHILFVGKAGLKHFNRPARFGVNAMQLLISKMIRLGGRKEAFIAKIFGGSQIMQNQGGSIATGLKNVAFVKEYLKLESIEIATENTGGTDIRTIFFHTDSGDVYLRRTSAALVGKLLIKERRLLSTLI